MRMILIAAAIVGTTPSMMPQPAAADTIYPWCLYDTRGGVNCGFVTEQQCRWSKTANADYCGPNGLYDRVRYYDRPPPYYYGPPGYGRDYNGRKRYRYYRD